MNKYYTEFSSCCTKLESGIKNAGYAAAFDFVFGARLVDRLGVVSAELRA
jgi:hypothetical protein